MVRMSDILKRGRGEAEEPRKKKLEETKVKKGRVFPRPPKKEEIKKEFSPEVVAKEVIEKEGKPPASQVKIAKVIMEKTKVGRPQPEQIYEEFITLMKDILAKGASNEPIKGKEIIIKIDKLIDQIAIGNDALMSLTERSTPDNYLYGHTFNVCLLSIKIGLALGYNKSRLNELGVSSLLFDIGMVKVMDVAQNPRRLTDKEYKAVKKHPIYGVEILEKAKDLTKVVIYVAREQHERIDGSGYPKGLKGDEINEYARIVGLVDVYEALTHPRPHRKRLLPYEAMKQILKNKAQFEPRFIKVLIEEIGIYPIGSWVELNTGEVGKVVSVNKGFPLRPTLNVIFGHNGRKLEEIKSIELVRHPTLYIKKPLDDSELEARFPASQ